MAMAVFRFSVAKKRLSGGSCVSLFLKVQLARQIFVIKVVGQKSLRFNDDAQ
jgi:hypothetical protein